MAAVKEFDMIRLTAYGAAVLGAALAVGSAWAQTPIPPAPKDFLLMAAQSDHYEMLAASVALAQAGDPRVRAFAERMLQDHRHLEDDLRKAADLSGLELPATGMSSDQALLLSGLQSLRGPDFEKAYARQQVLAHTQAVAVQDSFAASGSDPHLRAAVQAALPTIRDHLKQAQQLKADLDKS